MKLKSNLMLVLTAMIWGSAFVAQSVGMDYIGPFTFNSLRCVLGALVLIPVILLMGRGKKAEGGFSENGTKTLLLGGICCGAALAVASSLQQIGLVYTSAGKAGFITALYILIVPILGLFLGKKVGGKIWIGVVLAVAGMYFLCMTGDFSIAYGDVLVLLCAVVFSLHILVVDYFSPKVDGVKMSCIQFLVCGVLCGIPMILLEHPQLRQIFTAWKPVAYAGVLSCGVAYTLQIVAQKHTDPTVASLIMSLESVFAALTGWLILGERLSTRELLGCLLVFSAILLAQLPEKPRGTAQGQVTKEGNAADRLILEEGERE